MLRFADIKPTHFGVWVPAGAACDRPDGYSSAWFSTKETDLVRDISALSPDFVIVFLDQGIDPGVGQNFTRLPGRPDLLNALSSRWPTAPYLGPYNNDRRLMSFANNTHGRRAYLRRLLEKTEWIDDIGLQCFFTDSLGDWVPNPQEPNRYANSERFYQALVGNLAAEVGVEGCCTVGTRPDVADRPSLTLSQGWKNWGREHRIFGAGSRLIANNELGYTDNTGTHDQWPEKLAYNLSMARASEPFTPVWTTYDCLKYNMNASTWRTLLSNPAEPTEPAIT